MCHDIIYAIRTLQGKNKKKFQGRNLIATFLGISRKLCNDKILNAQSKNIILFRKNFVTVQYPLPKEYQGIWRTSSIIFQNQDRIENEFQKKTCKFFTEEDCLINLSSRVVLFEGKQEKIYWEILDNFNTSLLSEYLQRNNIQFQYLLSGESEKIIFPHGQLLFHGTSVSNATKILKGGFDKQKRKRQVFGTGEYFTNCFQRAKCYGKCIILTEVNDSEEVVEDVFVSKNNKRQIPRAMIVI